MQRSFSVPAAAVLVATASAQFNVVIPNGTAAAPGNSSNAFPWGSAATTWPGLRLMCVYDSTNFTAQGVTFPVVINRLKWRPNDTSAAVTGGTFTTASVNLSTAPIDWSPVTTSFASNHGANMINAFTGSVVHTATPGAAGWTPASWCVDIPLTTSFLYDPNGGDLVIDVDYPGGANFVGGTVGQMDVHGTGSNSARIFASSLYPNANGTTLNHGVVVEVGYVPAAGLYAGFTANVTTGASPLSVNFTDQTFTSDPGGVTSWAWDLDGDNVIDSTAQNPSFVYSACADYNVSLTVTDASHQPNTLSRTAYIRTDNVTPSFTFSAIAPGVIQFTDTSTPTPTSWAWDLDGDNIVDSTVQNPVWVYPSPCTSTIVTLTVHRLCRGPFATSQSLVLSPLTHTTLLTGGNGLTAVGSGNTFDIQVNNPDGINICAITMCPYMATPVVGAPLGCTVWVTDAAGGFLANHTNGAVWRQVASGTGTFAGGTFTAPVPVPMALSNPIYLPSGTYGMAIHMTTGSGVAYTTLTATTTYPGPDFDIICGNGKGAPFNTTANANRAWNGSLHYSTVSNGALAGYGFFASGCAGTMGISRLTPTGVPALGSTLTVTVDNLPLSVAIMMIGFSRTLSVFGPLPLDVTPFGAPGCWGRVSPDVTSFLFGAGNAANWLFGVPNDPALLAVTLFNQALVPDPGFNTLGAVFADAAALVVGN